MAPSLTISSCTFINSVLKSLSARLVKVPQVALASRS